MSVREDNVNVNVNINGERGGQTLKQLRRDASQLRKELAGLVPGTQAFIDKMKELQAAEKNLQRIQNEIKGVGGWFSKATGELKKFALAALAFFGVNSLLGAIQKLVTKNAELSDSYADIRKTTGMTNEEVGQLDNSLKRINTRTPTEELRKIAVGAGQLGIAKADVLAFTAATDKLVVALGDEFKGGAEEVTKELGALRNIFGDIKTDKVDEDMLRIGNALNVLGSAGSATAPVVTDFAGRIGGVAIPMGFTSAQVLALSATLQELNVSAERGGTAVVKILQKMATNTAEFAKVAGVPLEEFTTMVDTDLYGAFMKVTEGAAKSGDRATVLAGILDDLKVDGAGASEVFTKLGSNGALLAEKLKLSQDALKNTASITEEFNVKNTNLAAGIEKLGKYFADAFANSTIMSGMKSMVDWMVEMTEVPLSETMEEERRELNLMELKLKDVNTTAEQRHEIIEKLKSQYPEYLEYLNLERMSNEDISNVLDKINGDLVTRIHLQRLQEKEQSAAKDHAQAQADLVEEEERAMDLIIDAQDRYNFKISEGLTLHEQIVEARDKIKSSPLAQDESVDPNSIYLRLGRQLEIIDSQQEAVTESATDYAAALAEINRQKALLGIGSIDEIGPQKKTSASPEPRKVTSSDYVPPPTELTDKEKAELKKEEEKLKQLRQKLDEANFQIELDKKNATEREIALIHHKYEKLREEAVGHSAEILRINQAEEAELTALRENEIKKRQEAYDKEQKEKKDAAEKGYALQRKFAADAHLAQMSENDREILQEQQKWDKLIRQAEIYGKDTATLEEGRTQAILAIQRKQALEEQKLQDEKNKKLAEDQFKQREQQIAIAGDVVKIFSAAGDAMIANAEDQAKFSKVMGLFEIGLASAVGVAQAVKAGAGLVFPANLGAIAAGVAAVFSGIAQAKKLFEDTGDAPEYEDGGVMVGPRHSDGGLAVINPKTGKKVAEVEGGEPFLSRETYANNPELVDALLDASMNRNGARISSPFNYKPRGVAYSSTRQAIQYDKASVFSAPTVSAGTGASFSSSSGPIGSSDAVLMEFIKTARELHQTLKNGVSAYFVYDKYKRDQEAINKAALSARIGRKQ